MLERTPKDMRNKPKKISHTDTKIQMQCFEVGLFHQELITSFNTVLEMTS